MSFTHSQIANATHNRFRWVACQTDVLRKCRTQKDIDTVLLTLPRTLEDTYSRILDAIDEASQPEVRAVLQWLAFSQRPMRLDEVAEIVAFDTSHASIDLTRRLLNPLDVLTMCSSLLVTNETHYGYDYNYIEASQPGPSSYPLDSDKASITELRLAHFTVKDYLLSQNLQESEHTYYKLEEKASNLQIARACLTYLNMEQFSQGYQGRRFHAALVKKWPLLDYSARFCGHHLKIAENCLEEIDHKLLRKLFSSHTLPNGGNFGTLVGTAWPAAGRELIQTTKPLYFAASHGLVTVVRLLLTGITATEIEALGGHYASSPLQVASYRGNTECVRLLLEAGADPNSTNALGETSLMWARIGGFDEIMDLLYKHGAVR